MNRLKKKAWTELIVTFVMIVVVIPCLLSLSAHNARGLIYMIVALVVGAPIFLIGYLIELKQLKKFDEREQAILRKSFSISAGVFVFYLLSFSFVAFFSVGGKQLIPVVLMPIMVLTGVFLGQCTQTFLILFQCAKEDDE